jgi:peptide/nickel transport system ATP-binding protein
MLMRATDIGVTFRSRRGRSLQAVAGVSFDLAAGETLGLVGESGCGKSTTGRAVMCLPRPTDGSVIFNGVELTALPKRRLRQIRPQLQIVFQDPISSLNPRHRVEDIVAAPLQEWQEPLHLSQAEIRIRVARMFDAVGLDLGRHGDRKPHEFSGGQAQRLSIARALILEPRLLVCDEPVSSLDVSIQAQILNLIEDMKDRYQLTVLFISHDLAVVRKMVDRIAVMYLGKLCEIGNADAVYAVPTHPYTIALLDSIPNVDPGSPLVPPQIHGELPSVAEPPSGCRFRTRCPLADSRCANEEPELRHVGADHFVACHYPERARQEVGLARPN